MKGSRSSSLLRIFQVGGTLVDYEMGMRLQNFLAEARRANKIEDTLLVLQVGYHSAVVELIRSHIDVLLGIILSPSVD